MTYQQRNAAYLAKIAELKANGMDQDTAHRVCLNLPEMQHVVDAMHKPGIVNASPSVKPGATIVLDGRSHSIATPEERSQVLANALRDLQDRLGWTYETAYAQVKGDTRFAPLFNAMQRPLTLVERQRQVIANIADQSNPDATKRNEGEVARLAKLAPRIKMIMAALAMTWDEAKALALSRPESEDLSMELPAGFKPAAAA
jgi:hypothetical protein